MDPSADLPAELTLRFGADRLHGRVHWPSPISGALQPPLILLITPDDRGRAGMFGASLCSAASAVVLSISAPHATRTSVRSADGVAVAALGWMADHAADLGADPRMMAVAGFGRAGASAARLATAARDDGWPRLRRQLLVDPLFGPADPMPSDLTGVAPASIATRRAGQYEGTRYAELLRAAGTDVEEIALTGRGLVNRRDLRRLTRSLRQLPQATTPRSSSMNTINSSDGTEIAFDQVGQGPPIIMVVGAFNTRSDTAPLAAALKDRLTTINYDRRGRGDSGDTQPYAVEREIEDLDTLIAEAGGSATVFGYSSGATLALKAAGHGLAISTLVLYDAPFVVDDSYEPLPADFAEQLAELISDGRRGDAVELFQRVAVGIPQPVIEQMRRAPFRPALEAMAHTLVYEAKVIGDRNLPTDLVSSIAAPTLVIDGEESPPIMRGAARELTATMPNATRRTLAGQGHDIAPEPTAAVIAEFLTS